MKLAISAGLFLFVLLLVGVGAIVFFNSDNQVVYEAQQFNTRPPTVERSAEDLTYSQEVRTLTARTRQLEKQLTSQRESAQTQIQDLQRELQKAQQAAESSLGKEVSSLSTENSKLREENHRILKNMEDLKNSFETLKSSDKAASQEELAAMIAAEIAKHKTELPAPLPSAPAEVEAEKLELAKTPLTPENIFIPGAKGTTPGEVPTTAGPKPSRVHHRPYGSGGATGTSQNGDILDQVIGNVGNLFTSGSAASPASSTNVFSGTPATSGIVGQRQAVNKKTKFPIYTLPVTTMLNDAVLITPMIGKVPIGNNVNDPYRFQLELGETNLAANGHRIPGVAKVIAAGTAFGNREQSCVRGNIHTLTFIFRDGRIHTVSSGSGASNRASGGLAYIADPWGKPCIRGEYINNSVDYLKSRSGAAFLQGLAAAYGDAQITRQTDSNGLREAFVSGNTYQYAAAFGLSNTANEIANYVRERALGAFDVVYVPQAQKVQLVVEQQINIDYDTKARKVSFLNNNSAVTYD